MYNLPKESDQQKISAEKYITIKLRSLSNNKTQTILSQIKRQNKFTYGTNLSAKYTWMIVADSQFGQEVEIRTS